MAQKQPEIPSYSDFLRTLAAIGTLQRFAFAMLDRQQNSDNMQLKDIELDRKMQRNLRKKLEELATLAEDYLEVCQTETKKEPLNR